MSNLTDFFPSGGGGLTPKFEEFNASGTFTPSQALIDAGGYIEVFLVGGGGRTGTSYGTGASVGEVLMKKMYLTSTSSCNVTIGSGGVNNGNSGSSSTFFGSSAGGYDLTSGGGSSGRSPVNVLTGGWGAYQTSAGTGTLGYGAGAQADSVGTGILVPKANSGSAAYYGYTAASGYCLIKWYE